MFGWEFPPNISGGLGTACKGLSKHLAQQGTEILFVLPRVFDNIDPIHRIEFKSADSIEVCISHKTFETELSQETISVMEVDSMLQPYQNEYTYQESFKEQIKEIQKENSQESFEGTLGFSGDYCNNLLAEVSRYAVIGSELGQKEAFDLIHAHDWMTFLAAIEAKNTSVKPLICHVHSTEFDRSGQDINEQIFNIEKAGFDAADSIVAVSQRTKDIIIKEYEIKPDKIVVIHNAVDKKTQIKRGELKKSIKEKIVLFLGRITQQKGPDYFIEAARKVLNQKNDVRFVMAGAGDMMPKMIERIAEYRMQKNFHFTGFLSGIEVEKAFAMSDLYVMPSVSEPFGITPFEAMLYNVPIIISKQSGVTEVLSHAIKVDFWDTDDLADKIIQILNDSSYANKLAVEGEKELQKISWDLAAHKMIKHYKRLL